jgi:hypothetical protein
MAAEQLSSNLLLGVAAGRAFPSPVRSAIFTSWWIIELNQAPGTLVAWLLPGVALMRMKPKALVSFGPSAMAATRVLRGTVAAALSAIVQLSAIWLAGYGGGSFHPHALSSSRWQVFPDRLRRSG